jgi:hypothetical protein
MTDMEIRASTLAALKESNDRVSMLLADYNSTDPQYLYEDINKDLFELASSNRLDLGLLNYELGAMVMSEESLGQNDTVHIPIVDVINEGKRGMEVQVDIEKNRFAAAVIQCELFFFLFCHCTLRFLQYNYFYSPSSFILPFNSSIVLSCQMRGPHPAIAQVHDRLEDLGGRAVPGHVHGAAQPLRHPGAEGQGQPARNVAGDPQEGPHPEGLLHRDHREQP